LVQRAGVVRNHFLAAHSSCPTERAVFPLREFDFDEIARSNACITGNVDD